MLSIGAAQVLPSWTQFLEVDVEVNVDVNVDVDVLHCQFDFDTVLFAHTAAI